MNLYFARHGESEANIQNVISNRGLQHPLTLNGRKQAARLAEHLKDAGLAGIFCSPIQRAVGDRPDRRCIAPGTCCKRGCLA